MSTKYVRLKRRDPQHGIVLRQYCYQGIRFLEKEGWYVVDDSVADYLEKHARQRSNDLQSPAAFDICTEKEARAIDEREAEAAQPRRPAENARVAKSRDEVAERPKRKRRSSKRMEEPEPEDEPAPETEPKEQE